MEAVGLIVDEKGNFVYEVGPKRILFDMTKLREQVGCDIFICNRPGPFRGGSAQKSKNGGSVGLDLKIIVHSEPTNLAIQRRIAEVLAHEVKHILQDERKGKLLGFFKKLTLFVWPLMAIFLMGTLGSLVCISLSVQQSITLSIGGLTMAACMLALSGVIFYECFDPDEKDAREFAEEAVKSEQWLEVIRVRDLKD